MIELRAGDATARIDPEAGGRVASLVVAGTERLVTGSRGGDPMVWGCYPMAPWAGRLRRGVLRFDGRRYQLPIDAAPHAIHGTVYRRAWVVDEEGSMTTGLGVDWPFAGHARQRITLEPDRLRCRLELHADATPMPATIGYHPWFAAPVELDVEPGRQYRRDEDGLPDGTLVPPGPRPWDDCFVGLAGPPTLTFGDGLVLTVTAEVDHWVLYTPQHAVCVEPQTGPPDGPHVERHVVEPGHPLVLTMDLGWAA